MALKKVECNSRPEIKVFNHFHSQSEENIEKFAEFIYISDEENSDDEHNYDINCNQFNDSNCEIRVINEFNQNNGNFNYIHEFDCISDNVLPPLIRVLDTIDEEDEQHICQTYSNNCYTIASDSTGTCLCIRVKCLLFK